MSEFRDDVRTVAAGKVVPRPKPQLSEPQKMLAEALDRSEQQAITGVGALTLAVAQFDVIAPGETDPELLTQVNAFVELIRDERRKRL